MAKSAGGHIVLVTGGNGFFGQHLIRELHLRDPSVTEIRVLDLVPFIKKLSYKESKAVIPFLADLRHLERCRKAFQHVDCVFHCAALVSYQFPPDEEALRQHNILASENVVRLCIEENIKSLIFTSTTEVVLRPYMKSTMAIIVHQTEAKARPPENAHGFLIPGYPNYKLKGEEIILKANNTQLNNGKKLHTVSLRPTILYGEEEHGTFLEAINFAWSKGKKVMRLFGKDSKQQVTYAGNAAWAHILAKKGLIENPERIAGLPIFVTDDTPIQDNLLFIQELTEQQVTITEWWFPAIISYLIAAIIELFIRYITFPLLKIRLRYSPTSIVSYFSSFFFFSRLRASIHLDYSPVYSEEISLSKSRPYYTKQLNCTVEENNTNFKVDKNNNTNATGPEEKEQKYFEENT